MKRTATSVRVRPAQRWVKGRAVFSALALALLVGQGAAAQAPQPVDPAPTSAVPVGANLNITPKRLTFGKGTRSATVYIFNQGAVPAAFDIKMVDRVMLPNGEIVAASDLAGKADHAGPLARLKSAKTMVVATPRRAVLAPGKGQTIRLRVIAPSAREAAEYRSHLTVTTMPPRDFGLSAEQAASAVASDRFDFTVASLFGLSIPVIVRSGTAEARGQIINAQVRTATRPGATGAPSQLLHFDVARSGPNSIYGNIEVRSKRSKEIVAAVRGVGIYPEIESRSFSLPLRRRVNNGESLEIVFVDDDINPGRVLTRADFVVP